MARIVGINSVNYIDKRKLESKLSFKEGEKFFAKVCSCDKNTGEVTLKLPNGWEFKAEISKSATKEGLEFMDGKVLKFKVEDFVNGKIQLSLPEEISNEELTSSLKNILGRLNLPDTKENIELLEKMIKHDITLDKDNVYIFKNLMFIKQRIGQNPEEADKLIKLFLMKCNINEDTENGQFIKNNLKEFFNVLNNTDNDVLLSLKENGLEVISKDNIDSMVHLNEKSDVLEKSIGDLLKAFKNCEENKIMSQPQSSNKLMEQKSQEGMNTSKMQFYKEIQSLMGNDDKNVIPGKVDKFIENMGDIDIKNTATERELLKDSSINTLDNDVPESSIMKDDMLINKVTEGDAVDEHINIQIKNTTVKENYSMDDHVNFSKEQLNKLANMINDHEQFGDTIVKNLNINKEFNLNGHNNNIVSETITAEDIEHMEVSQAVKKILLDSLVVKENISEKIYDIKKLIKEVINIRQGIDEVSQKAVMQTIKEAVNNLKVINSITDQYYYLDTPIKINDKNHEFKLIIKNNNKKRHEFDTKCVKIFASIKAQKLGCVDNFITINNSNMQIRICCNKNFMKVISSRKSELIESISLIGYIPTVIVDEKKEDINISNSAEFFQDQTFTMINQLI